MILGAPVDPAALSNGFEDSAISFTVSLIMTTLVPGMFTLGPIAGLIFLTVTLAFLIRSFFDSVEDLRTKGALWSCGFCLGLALLDPKLLAGLLIVVALFCYSQSKHSASCRSYRIMESVCFRL